MSSDSTTDITTTANGANDDNTESNSNDSSNDSNSSGPPSYTTRDVILFRAEAIGNSSSVLLHLDRDVDEDPLPFTYLPGHVVALEVPLSLAVLDNDDDKTDEKQQKTIRDAHTNHGWMRGPYTISSANANTLTILIQTVGLKSRTLAQAPPQTRLRIGGQFHVPIVQGIVHPAVKRLVMISTGVGIGPCVGAMEHLVYDPTVKSHIQHIDLVASFRTVHDILYHDYLNMWASSCDPPDRFRFAPLVTRTSNDDDNDNDTEPTGRIASSMERLQHYLLHRPPPPPEEEVLPMDEDNHNQDETTTPPNPLAVAPSPTPFCTVTETHYHLIGNGQMIHEWKQGLAQAGVESALVTVEAYFNHKAEPCTETIHRIAQVVTQGRRPPDNHQQDQETRE